MYTESCQHRDKPNTCIKYILHNTQQNNAGKFKKKKHYGVVPLFSAHNHFQPGKKTHETLVSKTHYINILHNTKQNNAEKFKKNTVEWFHCVQPHTITPCPGQYARVVVIQFLFLRLTGPDIKDYIYTSVCYVEEIHMI